MSRRVKRRRSAAAGFENLQALHDQSYLDAESTIDVFAIQAADIDTGESKFVFSPEFLEQTSLLKSDLLLDLLTLTQAAYAASLEEYDAYLATLAPKRADDGKA